MNVFRITALLTVVSFAVIIGVSQRVKSRSQGDAGSSERTSSALDSRRTGESGEIRRSRIPAKSQNQLRSAIDVEGVMRASLRAREIKEFDIEDVVDWSVLEAEEVDSILYEVGKVTVTVDTILGSRNIGLKAYILEGSVVQWTYAKTGIKVD